MRNILVVDSLEEERKLLSDSLSEFGLTVVGEAENGLVAYEKYVELKPDLITMNINMPVLDGISAVKKIIGDFPHAKIMMVSYNDDRTIAYEAIGSGALDFFLKTDDIGTLKSKLFSALGL